MDSHNILPLLGLALRGGNLAVGEEPVEAVARARDARLLLLASDAAEGTRRRTEHFAQAGQCLWLRLPFTKAELGRAVGRTSAAIVAVTDIGLANAAARKLAQLDEAQYGETSRRLELKAKRAAERQAEQRAHEKNARTGKRRPVSKTGAADGSGAEALRRDGPRRDSPGKSGSRKGGPRGEASRGDGSRSRVPRQTGKKEKAPSRPGASGTRGARANPYAHSRPVKKGKGSFRRRES